MHILVRRYRLVPKQLFYRRKIFFDLELFLHFGEDI